MDGIFRITNCSFVHSSLCHIWLDNINLFLKIPTVNSYKFPVFGFADSGFNCKGSTIFGIQTSIICV